MIAIWDGFNTNVETHENRNAGAAPNASMKYAHSAPDDVFIVPSSAYASAPDCKKLQVKLGENAFWQIGKNISFFAKRKDK